MSLGNYTKQFRRKLAYAGRHFTPTWRYGFNLQSTLAYRLDRPTINPEAARVVAELNRQGIALTSAETLLGDTVCFEELGAAIAELEEAWAERIAAERARANHFDPARKSFLFQLLGDKPALDPQSIFVRFALQPAILQIANAYFEMYTQLRFYNVWHTLTTDTAARESQLWHRDREDHLILKLFVYLSEIDDGAGPFTYAPGTHQKGHERRAPEYFLEGHVKRSTDEQMAACVPAARWLKARGPRGSLLFADTSGYHKGGLARERDRLMYVCMFTSPTSQVPEWFTRPAHINVSPNGFLDKAQALALGYSDSSQQSA